MIRHRVEDKLHAAAVQRVRQVPQISHRSEVRIGSPAAEIIAAAGDLHADLVCIGTHGRGGFARVLLGSVSSGLLERSEVAVLITPRGAETELVDDGV